ncbi:MAG: site-specific integrase [Lachnospiraceae bacterium]|nr:site-specific integrase [Lachnospiraceae bacterium]
MEKISKKYKKDTEISFGMVAERWLACIHNEKKHATYIKYYLVYQKHLCEKLGKLLFSELDHKTLAGVFQNPEQEAFSESLQKSISCVLNQILSYGVSHYSVRLLSYSGPGYKTGGKSVEVLNQSEQIRLLQYLYDEMDIYKLGIIICISTGLRLGELCALKWKDIDFEERLLHVNTTVQRIAAEGYKTKTILLEGEPKSNFSKREIPLSDELVRLLFLYQDPIGEYVINKKNPMEPRTYQNKFYRYLQFAGVKRKNFHILRHTFATNCISHGIDIKSLSEILGHSDVKITLNRYVHPTTEIKRKHMNSLSAIYGQLMGQ